MGDYDSFMMADIPGIIEGASDGRGLGLEFLKHIERTKSLLLMVDASNYREMDYQYDTLRHELSVYSEELSKRPFAVAITKVDALPVEESDARTMELLEHLGLEENEVMIDKYSADSSLISYGYDAKEWESMPTDKPIFILPISSVSHLNIDPLRFALGDIVNRIRKMEKLSQEEVED